MKDELHASRAPSPVAGAWTGLDDLVDQALATAPRLQPRARLAREVLRAVRSEPPAPLPFPWRRVLAGAGLAAAAALLTLALPTDGAAPALDVAVLAPGLALLVGLPLLLGWSEAV